MRLLNCLPDGIYLYHYVSHGGVFWVLHSLTTEPSPDDQIHNLDHVCLINYRNSR